ncbi:MAG: nitrate reductase cytochrome c-type subunit [Candidatus Thiosymbion ectosymbiont of Robbea hypermnestra]|nr:nitrate reductase cytochrome c-type subunit [Candidatus Thiosymbion ectosymbiont of Robbea hypermnestra]
MNKIRTILTLSFVIAGLSGAMPTFALDSLRGAAIEKMSAQPAKRRIDIVEGGIERSFEEQPPMIPHRIETYALNLRQQDCLNCHSRARAEAENTKPPSDSHFVDRDGNQLERLSSRRYFCTQCHMVQIKGKPLVENTFEGLE